MGVGIVVLVMGMAFLVLGSAKTEMYIETLRVQVTKRTEWQVTWKNVHA